MGLDGPHLGEGKAGEVLVEGIQIAPRAVSCGGLRLQRILLPVAEH